MKRELGLATQIAKVVRALHLLI